MTSLVKSEPVSSDVLEMVLGQGELSKLTPDQRVSYYLGVCASLGLNPLTRPFDFITFKGKTILYAKRDATDQIRAIKRISTQITSREKFDGIYVVTCRATTLDGHSEESTGAVCIEGLKSEDLANAYMRAETKAKRRVTLSIAGLGMLDDSELDGMQGAQVLSFDLSAGDGSRPSSPALPARSASPVLHTPDGEVLESAETARFRSRLLASTSLKEAKSIADDIKATFLSKTDKAMLWDTYQSVREALGVPVPKTAPLQPPPRVDPEPTKDRGDAWEHEDT